MAEFVLKTEKAYTCRLIHGIITGGAWQSVERTVVLMGEVKERWLSLEEIAEHLGVSRDTIYRWIAKKRMPAHRVGKLWKFKISEVDEWVMGESIW